MAGVLSRKYGINLHTFKRVYDLYRPGLTGTRLLYGVEQNSHSGHSMSYVLSDGYCMKAATIAKYRPHVLKFFRIWLYIPHYTVFRPEDVPMLNCDTEEEISVLADWVDDHLDRAVVEEAEAQKYLSFLRDLFRDEPVKKKKKKKTPKRPLRVGSRVVVVDGTSTPRAPAGTRGTVLLTEKPDRYRIFLVQFDNKTSNPLDPSELWFMRDELQREDEYLMDLAKEENVK